MSEHILKLQADFMSALEGKQSNVLDYLQEGGSITPAQRLSIYQYAYRARLVDVLDKDFPCLGKLLGDDYYEPLALAYISAHPSSSFTLNDFSHHLPGFLANYPPLADKKIVLEMARFEQCLALAFQASDSIALKPDFLATVAQEEWPELRFDLRPGTAVESFETNVPEVWQLLKDDQPPGIVSLPSPKSWLIWRQQLVTRFVSVDVDEAILLKQVHAGATFAELCENLLEWWSEDEVPSRAFGLLNRWLELAVLRIVN